MVQIMAWRRPGDKPLSEAMMVSLLTHICVTRPQWVNQRYLTWQPIWEWWHTLVSDVYNAKIKYHPGPEHYHIHIAKTIRAWAYMYMIYSNSNCLCLSLYMIYIYMFCKSSDVYIFHPNDSKGIKSIWPTYFKTSQCWQLAYCKATVKHRLPNHVIWNAITMLAAPIMLVSDRNIEHDMPVSHYHNITIKTSSATHTTSYSISQEICTRFCCALLCCGYAIVHNEFTWSIYPYLSGLLCWHWGNR